MAESAPLPTCCPPAERVSREELDRQASRAAGPPALRAVLDAVPGAVMALNGCREAVPGE